MENQTETTEERCKRLEREKELAQLKAEIESQASFENFWKIGGGLFSAAYRESARHALQEGNVEKARRAMASAEKMSSIGCVVQFVLFLILLLIVCFR